jgi:hypothetical protein
VVTTNSPHPHPVYPNLAADLDITAVPSACVSGLGSVEARGFRHIQVRRHLQNLQSGRDDGVAGGRSASRERCGQ